MNKPVTYILYAFSAATVLPMSATSIALGLLLLFFIWDLYRKNIHLADFKKDSLLYVLLYAWKAFTRTLATSIKEIPQLKGVWDRIPYIVIGFYAIHRKTVLRIFHILFIANSLLVLYALGQRYLGMPALYKPLFYFNSARISGYFGHPNQYAGCISIVLLLNICMTIYHSKRFFAYTPFLLLGLAYSGSRSYFLGVFVCFLVLLYLSRSWKTILTYSVVAVIALSVFMVAVPWFPERIKASFSVSMNAYRLNFWKVSWNTFLEHPVVGVGSGMLPKVLEPYEDARIIDNSAHAHSLYLHALAEDGVPGFILVVGIHAYFLYKYFVVFRKNTDPLLRAFSLGVALAFLNLLVAGVFENNFGAAIVAMNINFLMGVLEGYQVAGSTPT